MIKGATAFDTCKDLLKMASEKNSIIREILAEVLLVGHLDKKTYVLEHQGSCSRPMKAEYKRVSEASTYSEHMCRLLDGLSDDQQLNMNYLMSFWDVRSKAFAINVFKVGLKISKELDISASVLGTPDVFRKQKIKKANKGKCPKHPYMYHK